MFYTREHMVRRFSRQESGLNFSWFHRNEPMLQNVLMIVTGSI